MRMSQLSYEYLNKLLGASFDLNAQADNFAYNMNFLQYNKVGNFYHLNFAHAFPGDNFADGISGMMLRLGARPVRLAVAPHIESYTNLESIFADNLSMMYQYRGLVYEGIEIADINNDIEVRTFLENFILDYVTPYTAQAEEWARCVKEYSNIQFDTKIESLTNFIK